MYVNIYYNSLIPMSHALFLGLLLSLGYGCVQSRCTVDRDCSGSQVCAEDGRCVDECSEEESCGDGFRCADHRCVPDPKGKLTCPVGMAVVAGIFCMDRYEASRPDASATSSGTSETLAHSVAGVLPWEVADNATATEACAAAGKRLCTPREWRLACSGPDATIYPYGDRYAPKACNGIDAYGRDSVHLAPTGSFPGCSNGWEVYDLSGNLWEHVAGGDERTVRGGAYNCSDSAALHRCEYIPGDWNPAARGFRCCLTPEHGNSLEEVADDGAADPEPDPSSNDSSAEECVDDPEDPSGDPGPAPPTECAPDTSADATADDSALEPCPDDMRSVGRVCFDRYEASRSDATPTNQGTASGGARSRPGVLPWYVDYLTPAAHKTFEQACVAAGKRLCRGSEWLEACQGPEATTFTFGNTWDPSVCNSVDTSCSQCCAALGLANCPTGENCGYDDALTSSPYTPETCTLTAEYGLSSCHVCFHVLPTGAMPSCTNAHDLFDVNGNVWEVVAVPTSADARGYQVRGGAFNCGSPSVRFACTFNAGWADLYAGFRCCKDR
ncbi:MAG: hypothetical protein A2284_04615 [Deltaproteobacteria bacterium RIFOXYA12_FULL_61_11]|nr:MAG: hypothetical protein A2284_04615 [Deltaproteobacteria bacterium RIFOXYA12_FULL_61_11]